MQKFIFLGCIEDIVLWLETTSVEGKGWPRISNTWPELTPAFAASVHLLKFLLDKYSLLLLSLDSFLTTILTTSILFAITTITDNKVIDLKNAVKF